MKTSKTVGVMVLLALNARLFAAYPLATDDAGVVPKDAYELEAGFDDCRDEDHIVDRSCGTTFKHGVTDKMDLGITFPYQVDPVNEENPGAATLGFKFSLVKDIVAVSFSNELGGKEYFVNAIYTKEFSGVIFDLNTGYLSTGDETKRGKGTYGFAVEVPVQKFDIVGEVQGEEGGAGSALAGARYRITDAFFVAAAVYRTFAADMDKVTGGFHFEF